MPSLEKNAFRFLLSEEKHEQVFQKKIVPKIFANIPPHPTPIAILFGGQPGSGKSAAVDAAVKELSASGSAALIVGDDFRDLHPAYSRLLQEQAL